MYWIYCFHNIIIISDNILYKYKRMSYKYIYKHILFINAICIMSIYNVIFLLENIHREFVYYVTLSVIIASYE